MNSIEEAPMSPMSSTDNSDIHQEIKIVEARTAVLLDKGTPLINHNDSIQWLLKHLFRPLTTRTYQGHSLLYLSANNKPIWEHTTERHSTDNRTLGAMSPSLSTTTGISENIEPDSHATTKSPSKLYILTPRTNILSVANSYSMVFMVDLSSSLATIDMLRGHIMIENAFDLLANTLLGIVRPFSLSLPYGTNILFEPTICITVIAECSQFGSNINVIPILAEYPTMRVLLQNVNINTSNVYAVLQTLSSEVKSFQYDLGKFRQQITQRRSKLGYQLDVRYDHSSLVEEGETEYDVGTVDTSQAPIQPSGALKTASVDVKTPTSPSTLTGGTKKTMKKGAKATRRTAQKTNGTIRRPPLANTQQQQVHQQVEQEEQQQDQDQQQEQQHTQQQQQQQKQNYTRQQRGKGINSWKKDVWGVGKTGSNLSYILRAGAFALTLLPPNGRRSIVLMTDGVVKSNVDESVLRQLSCDNIACHVVHIGVEDGFTPGCNFGFVPDTEILQFVTNATGGHFTHSSQNPLILTDVTTIDSIPNIYHLRFLTKEIVLEKARSDNRLLATTTSGGSFPWTTNILPVPVEVRLMRYREYYLPKDVWLVIGARIRQGFSLASVVFDDNTHRKGPSSNTQDQNGNNSNNGSNNHSAKRERVTIILVLQWQPHVAVEYRVRAYWSTTWAPLLKQNFPSLTQHQQSDYHNTATDTSRHGIYNGMISPKAEILIRANHTFSEMLKNWDMFQRRMQMMGVVNGGAGMELAGSTAGFSKVGKLKKLLDRIFESDNMLKTLVASSSSSPSSSSSSPHSSLSSPITPTSPPVTLEQQEDRLKHFRSSWLKMNDSDLRPYTRYWYDEQSFDILTSAKSTEDGIPSATDQLYESIHNQLETWATFTHKGEVYIKVLNGDLPDDSGQQREQDCPRYCELRTFKEKEKILMVRLLFFGTNSSQRQQIVDELKCLLVAPPVAKNQANDDLVHLAVRQRSSSSSSSSSPLMDHSQLLCWVAQRPLSSLLMRDPEHYMVNEIHIDQQQVQMNMWYGNSTLWVTGEYIVRNYLYHNTIHWDLQDHGTRDMTLTPMLSLAYEFMCRVRMEQGYILLSSHHNGSHFYKEVHDHNSLFAVQYYIWKDPVKKEIVTELWMEPSSLDRKAHKLVESDMVKVDKDILTRLVTFEHIAALSHSCRLNDHASNDRSSSDHRDKLLNTQHIRQHHLFNISSILRLGTFWLASYRCPTFIGYQENDHKANDILASAADYPGHEIWKTDKNSNCTCPRSGDIFYQNRNAISTLSPIHRDMVFLHYFVERSLGLMADYQISLDKTSTSKDDFWATLLDTITDNNQQVETGDLRIGQSIHDLRCFVKSTCPSSMTLILIPSFETVIKCLTKLESSNQNQAAQHQYYRMDHTGILMYECHRQSIGSPDATIVPATRNNNSGESLVIQSLTSAMKITGILPDGTWQGSFGDGKNPDDSTSLSCLMAEVTQVFSRSFVKSIFTSLLHGRVVDASDFEKVLNCCHESTLDIDITGYLNVQTLLDRRGRQSKEEIELAHRRFVSVLGHYFEPVVTTNGQHQNIYCYRPPFTKAGQKLGFSLLGQKPSNLADVVECAQNPLFLRLECVLRKPAPIGGRHMETTFTFDQIPSSYHYDDDDVTRFEPEVIGTDVSPVASADGTSATLRLVCLTLPSFDGEPSEACLPHTQGCPAATIPMHHQPYSFLDNEHKQRDNLSSLNTDKQDALLETESRLVWLFTEEIMHGLLRSGPITPPVIRYVETQLMKKNPFVDFPTTMFIPLVFVKNQQQSRETFFAELEKARSTPYRLVRVGDSFYACDDDDPRSPCLAMTTNAADPYQEPNGHYDIEGLNISIDVPSLSQVRQDPVAAATGPTTLNKQKNIAQASDEYCQGLGISLLDPEPLGDQDNDSDNSDDGRMDTSDDDNDNRGGQESTLQQQQLYWLLLIPQKQSVQIYFYSKLQQSVNRSEIIRMTKAMVNEVMERTNKLVLLQSMHDSRICSKYLLAPSDDSEREQYSSSDDLSSDDFDTKGFGTNDNLVEILSTSGEELALTPPKKFQPGQFGCDILLTKRFPLHWRLQPNSALTILSNEVLRPFAVKNRPNMFVIMRDNVVVYCFLSEGVTSHSLDSDSQNDNESLYLRPGSPCGGYSLQPIESNGDKSIAGDVGLGVSHSKLHNTSFSSFVGTSSPHGSPHSERASTTKDSPGKQQINNNNNGNLSPSIKKHGTRYVESRELLFEVHGVEFGGWISELVEMLESRLMSQIIMKEVQQFLTRNPTSKLSRADLEFILPVGKMPSLRRTLRITPVISNPSHFLALLRQNILVGPLRALDGTDIASLVRRHRMIRYGSYSGGLSCSQSNISPGVNDRQLQDLCFYYSCNSRTPGLCSPFELSVGQGVAGICLSLLDKNGTFITHLPKTKGVPSIDDLQLEAYLNDDYLMDGGTDDSLDGYLLGIDIWPIGQIEGDFLLNYIYDCFKHTICDYIVEQVIQTALTEPLLVENHESGNINFDDSTHSIKAISTPFLQVLDKAIEWESPTVKQLSWSTNLAPWCMDDVLLQLETELNVINSMLKPIITCAALSQDLDKENELLGEHSLYDPALQLASNGDSHQNSQYMVISGLPELGITSGFSSRRHSTESYWSQNKKWNMAKDEDYGKQRDPRKEDNHHRQDSVASSMSKSGVVLKQKLNYKEADHHHCFVLLIIDCVKTTMYVYNCTEVFTDQVSQIILRTLVQQESRHLALENIVHQKMGLFHHTHTMSSILTTCSSVSNGTASNYYNHNNTSSNSSSTNTTNSNNKSNLNSNVAFHPSLSTVINQQSQQDIQLSSSPNASSIARLAQSEPRTRSASGQTDTISSSKVQVNFNSLKQLITNTFSSRTRPSLTDQRLSSFYSDMDVGVGLSIFDVEEYGRLCRSPKQENDNDNNGGTRGMDISASDVVYTAVRMADANSVFRDAFAEAMTEYQYANHRDYLIRHGEPFLNMYLRRSKLQAAHEKAFKVYSKWADRYSFKSQQQQQQLVQDEMMTVSELLVILKASRILHFCRTPLFLSDIDSTEAVNFGSNHLQKSAQLFDDNKQGTMDTTMATRWYENLTHTFMKDYASYLESIGMHLIVYGSSTGQQEEIKAYLSKFRINSQDSVSSPVTYLLKVYNGGTVLCEARLTGVFVSVTLYTLHRRYGRLTYSPYTHEKHEMRRAGFHDFTKECDGLKQKIHVNSFVSDFRLRFIQRSLDNIEDIPSNLNLVNMIDNMVSLHGKRPGGYSRNRIVHGSYKILMEEKLDALLPTLLKNADSFGFSPLMCDKKLLGCFVSSDDISFERGHDDPRSPFRYSLIITPLASSDQQQSGSTRQWPGSHSMYSCMGSVDSPRPSNSHMGGLDNVDGSAAEKGDGEGYQSPAVGHLDKITLHYYVIVTYQGMNRDPRGSQTAWKKVVKNKPERYENILDEVLVPDMHSLDDVLQQAKRRIDTLIKQAAIACHRDADWNRLYQAINTKTTNQSSECVRELIKLTRQFETIKIDADIDPQLCRFLSLNLRWNTVLDVIKQFYPLTSGELVHQTGGSSTRRHVVLFVPNAVMEHFVLMECFGEVNDDGKQVDKNDSNTINDNKLHVYACSKHKRQQANELDDLEKQFMGNLATTLGYHLWKCTK
ncbi:hypothetical protein BC941DRAFT_501290 [Chlamydoabsidia padenii]|nr:hypothetical protein BC941DRAFT_501290 [Chlamydoabsidia padenii]